MKKYIALLLLLQVNYLLSAQGIVGEWKLIEGKYNGSTIPNLTGTLNITAKVDTVNYQATFDNGTYNGYASSEYKVQNSQFKTCLTGQNLILNGITFGFNSCGKYYTSLSISLNVFQQWGGIAIGYYDPSFTISGNMLTFTSPDGKTVLKYENQNPSAAGESQDVGIVSWTISPNPISTQTAIRFALVQKSWVRLSILDGNGRLMEVLTAANFPAGTHEIIWQPYSPSHAFPFGVYLCQLEINDQRAVRRLVVAPR